nr:hypothetical protein [Tanacetum cinerariifolium]
MPFRHTRTKRRRLRKTFTSTTFEHFQENISAVEDTIPAGDGIPAVAQTIPAGSTPIPTTGGVSAGLSAQRRQELDAAQLIYTKADWLELMAKIATNSALFKQLLGDDVNEDNMNERQGVTPPNWVTAE